MIDYSIGESPLAYEKQFKQILKHIGVRSGIGYTIPSYFHCFVNGPRKSQLRVIAMEIKIDDPGFEDSLKEVYVANAALKIALKYLKNSRYFILGGNFDGWAEITKAEYIALRILERIDYQTIASFEYEPELNLITIKGKRGDQVTGNADSIEVFLKVLDKIDDIRSGDLYTRIKEAKHE